MVTLLLHRDVPAPWQGEVNHSSVQSVGGLPMVMVQCLHRLFAEPASPAPAPHPFRLPCYPFRSEMPAPSGAQGRKEGGADDVMALVQMLLPLPPLRSQEGLPSRSLPTPLFYREKASDPNSAYISLPTLFLNPGILCLPRPDLSPLTTPPLAPRTMENRLDPLKRQCPTALLAAALSLFIPSSLVKEQSMKADCVDWRVPWGQGCLT